MLPILRILPVAGVLLAFMLLALALGSPDGSRAQLMPNVTPARGAMIERGAHPEWRQFLILAAIQRADELNRLRELPDTPTRTDAAPAAPKVAGLPTDRSDSDPEGDSATGSVVQPPAATIPVDIGESSSVELPVAAPEVKPPVTKTPQLKSQGRIKGVHHSRRARAAARPDPALQSGFFDFFGNQSVTPAPTYGIRKVRRARVRAKPKATPTATLNTQTATPAPTINNQATTPALTLNNQSTTPAPAINNQSTPPTATSDNQPTPPAPSAVTNYY